MIRLKTRYQLLFYNGPFVIVSACYRTIYFSGTTRHGTDALSICDGFRRFCTCHYLVWWVRVTLTVAGLTPQAFIAKTPLHTCQPREKFRRDKGGATERSEPTSEGGSGGPPPKIFINLHGKWCNLRYS